MTVSSSVTSRDKRCCVALGDGLPDRTQISAHEILWAVEEAFAMVPSVFASWSVNRQNQSFCIIRAHEQAL